MWAGDSRSRRSQDVDSEFRTRIRCLMAMRGQTQSTLGKRMGLSQSTISLVLAGRRHFSGTTTIERFADALDVPASTIQSGAPWPAG